MKKRLEAELISIAHRILKLKNKSEVDQLHAETRKLYETLSILKFYQDNIELVKSDVSLEELENKINSELETPDVVEVSIDTETERIVEVKEDEIITEEAVLENNTVYKEESIEENQAVEIENESEVENAEQIKEQEVLTDQKVEEKEETIDEPFLKPVFELTEDDEDEKEDESSLKTEPKQISFEDLLGEDYVEPVFVKPSEISTTSHTSVSISEVKREVKREVKIERKESRSLSLNDSLSKSISIGLNDRIGFVKHLFGESNEDYNRVLSQLNSFNSFEEAENFINDMVKPDYNYWEGKEDYSNRFMEIVEKKFI